MSYWYEIEWWNWESERLQGHIKFPFSFAYLNEKLINYFIPFSSYAIDDRDFINDHIFVEHIKTKWLHICRTYKKLYINIILYAQEP